MSKDFRRSMHFVGIVYAASWLIAGVFYAAGGNLRSTAGSLVSIGYMFVPLLSVLFLQKTLYKEPVLRPFDAHIRVNRWLFVAWLTPPALAFAALGAGLVFPGVAFSPQMEGMYERFGEMLSEEQLQQMRAQAQSLPVHPIWIGLFEALLAGMTINAVAGFGEEIGWRGFLQKHLAHLGFWKSCYLIGFIWGVWHWPIIAMGHNYPQHPGAGIFMMIVLTMLLSPLFGYVRIKGRSVVHAAVAHGTFNASYGLAIIVLLGGGDLLVGMTGLAGFIVLAALNVVLYVTDRSPDLSDLMSSDTANV
jgi:membrane protease YdiL (CAAX protease family)